MKLLTGKRAVIFGIINRYSLAYGIASAMREAGAEISLSYQNSSMTERIRPLAKNLDATFFSPCDVTQDDQMKQFFTALQSHWDMFDILVHSVAYAPKAALRDDYLDNTTRADFQMAHDISSYSFTALAKHAKTMIRPKGVLLTLTYLGSQQVVSHYNVMGLAKASLETNVRYMANSLGPHNIRVNAISAGPCRTLAASGIKDFHGLIHSQTKQAPLKEIITPKHIGQTAACLCSDWMSGVTGEVIHVDGGFHIF